MTAVRYMLAFAVLMAACHAPEGTSNSEGATTATYGAAVQGLQMLARPLDKVVPAHGPLWVEITVRNVADSIVSFRPMFTIGGWLRADITAPNGQLVPKTASVDPPSAWAVSLEPGESVTDTTDLLCPAPGSTREFCVPPYELSTPGEYDVKLRFSLPCYPDECIEPVTIEAPPFTVRVETDGGR